MLQHARKCQEKGAGAGYRGFKNVECFSLSGRAVKKVLGWGLGAKFTCQSIDKRTFVW
jgi:hypothetical protein